MQFIQGKHNLSVAIILTFIIVICTSFLPSEKEDSDFLFVSVISSSNETYESIFPANTDSVIIPLKKAGRLFLIDAKVEDLY
jgi:hypothetical protein